MSRFKRDQTKGREGFTLPAVLTVVGVVTLIFMVAITALQSLTHEARLARERIQFLQSALTTEAQIGFMMVTSPFNANGLVPNRTPRDYESAFMHEELGDLSLVAVDGRLYMTGHPDRPVAISLQDQGGMINLNTLNREVLDRLFTRLGIAENQFQLIEARLRDYVDSDDLTSIGGAESSDYGAKGLANRPLRYPNELLAILGLREQVSARAWRDLYPHLSADLQQSNFNVNTATPEALKVLLNLNEDQVLALIEARKQTPFLSTQEIDSVIGASVLWDEERLYTTPYSALYLTVYDKSSQWYYRSRLDLTPISFERPLWIDQNEITEAPKRAKPDMSNAPRLPYTPY